MKFNDKQALARYQDKLEMIRSGMNINPNETREEQLKRITRAKKDVAFFVRTYFPHYATAESADFQIDLAKKTLANPTCKILVRWGRGLAKSVWSDVVIPMWLWINDDIGYMVIVGNNYDKACILLGDLQAEFESNQLLIRDFGEQVKFGNWEDGYFRTKNGFIAKALGMGQEVRGLRVQSRRPDYIVCDDLEDKDTVKNPKRQDEVVKWVEASLLPTMDGSRRRYLHPNNDFTPRSIQNQLEAKHPNWTLSRIDACRGADRFPRWVEKYPTTYYKELEQEIGTIALESEYNNEPHVEGTIFTDELIQWGKRPNLDKFSLIIGFWDVAYSGKNDYNAVKVWGLHGRNFWHLKAFCKQCKMNEAVRFMYDYEKSLPPTVIVHWRVEKQFWNDPVREAISAVEREMGRPLNIVVVDRPTSKKYDRILSLHPYYQNGRTYYDEAEKANNDMQVGIAQLKSIEPGYKTHDDAPDADEQAINILAAHVRTDAFEPLITPISQMRMGSRNRF